MLIRDGCCDGLVTIGVAQVKVAPVIIYSAIGIKGYVINIRRFYGRCIEAG